MNFLKTEKRSLLFNKHVSWHWCLDVPVTLKIRVSARWGRLTDRQVMRGSIDWSDVGWRWQLQAPCLGPSLLLHWDLVKSGPSRWSDAVRHLLVGSVAQPSIKFRVQATAEAWVSIERRTDGPWQTLVLLGVYTGVHGRTDGRGGHVVRRRSCHRDRPACHRRTTDIAILAWQRPTKLASRGQEDRHADYWQRLAPRRWHLSPQNWQRERTAP